MAATRGPKKPLPSVEVGSWWPDPSDYPNRVVTSRSGRWASTGLLVSLVFTVLLARAIHSAGQERAEWEGGVPAVVVVAESSEGQVSFIEADGERWWSIDEEHAPTSATGDHVEARLMGTCRCQLNFDGPEQISGWLVAGWLGLLALTAAQLRGWLRWRRVRNVLTMEPRQVQVRPVWLRRGVRAPRWAVETIPGELHVQDPAVLELAGTPPWWFDADSSTVLLRGPDRPGGVVTMETDHGIAVASSAPMSDRATRSRICEWSDELTRLLSQRPETPSAPVEIEGSPSRRVSVSDHQGGSDSPSAQLVCLDASALRSWLFPVAVIHIVGTAVVGARSGWGPQMLVFSVLVALSTVTDPLRRARHLREQQPLVGWTDRRSAAEAARAASLMDYVAAHRVLVPGSGARR